MTKVFLFFEISIIFLMIKKHHGEFLFYTRRQKKFICGIKKNKKHIKTEINRHEPKENHCLT